MAQLGRAHGIRGEITGVLTGIAPEVLEGLDGILLRRTDGSEVAARVRKVRPRGGGKGGWILDVDVLTDRTEAEMHRGSVLVAPREQLPPPGEEEWYVADLVGCSVATEAGRELGVLEEVLKLPANDVFVVRGEQGEVLLPLIDDVVRSVDLGDRKIVVRLLPGLVEGVEP